MTYQEARAFLAGKNSGEIHLALDRIQELLRRLGNPQDQVPAVHIAGTNGKGSILAYISTTLTEAGYRTGSYCSPVVYHYGEQFRIDGQDITEEKLVKYTAEIAEQVQEMEQDGWVRPSGFELETALAFLYFVREGCDICVVECGMGGRDDATNVISRPLATVFSTISMDHTAFLGKTLEEITKNKAGIMRQEVPVITSYQEPEVMKVLGEEAEKNHAPLIYASPEKAVGEEIDGDELAFIYSTTGREIIEVITHLPGHCQILNAVTAIETLREIGKNAFPMTNDVILSGVAHTRWPGRFTRVARHPDFLVDGAHNPGAARELRRSIDMYYPGKKFIFIIGMFKDKDHENVLKVLAPRAKRIFTIETPGHPRALPARQMAEKVKPFNSTAEACDSLREAVQKAREAAGEDGVVLSFGSLSNIAEITKLAKAPACERS